MALLSPVPAKKRAKTKAKPVTMRMRCFGLLALAKVGYQAVYQGKNTSTLPAPIAPGNAHAASPAPASRTTSLVDSSAYLALLDTDDEHHSEAIETLQALAQARYRQFTTNVLLIESHALILSVLGREEGRPVSQRYAGE